MSQNNNGIIGYKGFDKNMQCHGLQFEVGKEYVQTGKIECCSNGFHFCESPFDVFYYYPPPENRYCDVVGSGEIDQNGDDSKIASSHLRINKEIKLPGIISAGVKFILNRIDWENNKKTNTGDRSAATTTGNRSAATNTGNRSAATNTGNLSAATNTGHQSAATNTGYRSAATNTGDQSAATNTGDRSAATNTGDRSAAKVDGRESISCGLGYKNKAMGSIGCWIVLSEWEKINGEYHIVNVKSRKVDGKHIKPETWYMLKNNKFVEVE